MKSLSMLPPFRVAKFTVGVFAVGVSMSAAASEITNLNLNNIELAPGPYIDGTEYANSVYLNATKTNKRAELKWVQGDVMAPGIQVVKGTSINGSACVMAAGVNPNDGAAKTCSDPADTTKHFTLSLTTLDNIGVDLAFDVLRTDSPRNYQVYQMVVNNNPRLRIASLALKLGFDIGLCCYTESSGLDGLAFANASGTPYTSKVVNYNPAAPQNFSAMLPSYLFGPTTGFFDGQASAYFEAGTATENRLNFSGISLNYSGPFGPWLSTAEVPTGIIHDHDGVASTQSLVAGYWNGSTWLGPDGSPVNQATLESWSADPLAKMGPIKGLSAIMLRYNISVGSDISAWPTYNFTTGTASFTVRVIPTLGQAGSTTHPWETTPYNPATPAPKAGNDTYTLEAAGAPINITDPALGLLKNDSAASRLEMSARSVTQPNSGTVTVNANGTFRYAPDETYDFSIGDSFTYVVNDTFKDSLPATVTISGGKPPGCAEILLGVITGPKTAARIDPTLPLMMIGSLGLLIRRRKK